MKTLTKQEVKNLALAMSLAAVVLFQSLPARAGGDNDDKEGNRNKKPQVLSPAGKHYGKTYGEWSEAFWQWAFSMPTTRHPMFDSADVGAGQQGTVWFLSGNFTGTPVTRNVTIPSGTALFIPLVNIWADNTDCNGSGQIISDENSESVLRANAKAVEDTASDLSCTIDGIAVPGLANALTTPFRIQSSTPGGFSYTLPASQNLLNYFGLACWTDPNNVPLRVDASIYHAVADGYYVLIAPLAPGPHTITCHGTANGFTESFTYNITVLSENLGNEGIFPPDSKPYGRSYGEWAAKDWQWIYSLPIDHHPLFDTADVSTGQSGPLWFLGGSFTTTGDGTHVSAVADRSVNIPYGKALLVPIVNAESASAEGNGTDESQFRVNSIGLLNHAANLTCVIDGKAVKNIEKYRSQSPLFSWGPLPANNIFQNPVDFPAGLSSPSVADGFQLILAPLKPGLHTIHYTSAISFTEAEDGFDLEFTQDITYHISVGKPNS